MSHSKISICNISLARLGADSIRSFDENNKRARMCDVFFDSSRSYLLAKFDWDFARKVAVLRITEIPSGEEIDGLYPYQLPPDCKRARYLHPKGSRTTFEIIGDKLYCPSGPEDTVQLYYTYLNMDTSKYADEFVELLVLHLAIKMCMPLTQDKQLMGALKAEYVDETGEAWESDANTGNEYREPDEDPNNDSFVNPNLGT